MPSTTHTARPLAACAVLAVAGAAHAEPVQGTYVDGPLCDNHGSLFATEEFGDPAVFAQDEALAHVSTTTFDSACPATDNPDIPNAVVEITNLTGRTLTDLFYVGDPSTFFSNSDGIADAGVFAELDGLAFRIDAVGSNRPLIFESVVSDGILQPAEVWLFIVQDYSSPIGAPDSFTSIGFADASVAVVETSAASIVQFVPAPGPLAVLGATALLGIRRRRRP